MADDKRLFPRFSFSEPVAYGQPEVAVNGSVAGNISIGGISLVVQEFVPVGTVLELQINLGRFPKVVWTKAQVVRIREVSSDDSFEIGLKFVEDRECRKAVNEYIKTYMSKSVKEHESHG